ncbi:hypothetical protein B7P43_G09834, partial [Cryptotermes secundus]
MINANLLWCVRTALLPLLMNVCGGAKILGIFPSHSRSHAIISSALMRELAARGHHVTVLSMHPQVDNVGNYTDIVLKSSLLDLLDNETKLGMSRMQMGIVQMFDVFFNLDLVLCDLQLQEESVQELVHSKDLSFDLIIVEAFNNECFLGFVHKFQAPLIHICTFAGFDFMGHWVGNPNPYAYVPSPILKFRDKMNFWERMINTILGTSFILVRNHYYLPRQNAIMRKHFNDSNDLPELSEIEHRTSVLFVNQHLSTSYPKPLMPSIVQVGGIHVKPPKKLPQDIQSYLDEASEGAIFFSMGSNVKSSEMPEGTIDALIKAFSKVKQRVLWKWETETFPGRPSNVKLGKWLPQADILAHPNTRLFMTHGGLLSMQEAIDRGVPVVGIPVFGDQKMNMMWAVSQGFGVSMDFNNITSESVSEALSEVLGNPRYRENSQRLSRIFRDQPLTP